MPIFVAMSVNETPIGQVVHRWTENGLYDLRFSRSMDFAAVDGPQNASATDHDEACRFSELLDRYFMGERVAFDEIRIASDNVPDFYARVYHACRKIPAGETLSYANLAERCGRRQAARAVGQAMARNRVPIVIPCHRVIGSSGRLTGFSAPGGIDTKRWLLNHERVANCIGAAM